MANVNEQYVADGVKGWLEIDTPTTHDQLSIDIVVANACATIKDIRSQDISEDIETKYRDLAIEMAVYLYEKKGVDGVSSFSENGISRVYEKGTYPSSMLRRITPRPRVLHSSRWSFNPNPTNAKCLYSVISADSYPSSPKGEWLTFTWDQGEGWSNLGDQAIYFELWYAPNSGADYLVYRKAYSNAVTFSAKLNVPDVEQKNNIRLDTTCKYGAYYLVSSFPSLGTIGRAAFEFTGIDWNNERLSEVTVNEIKAQDTILPLMDGHWLVG